MGGTELDEEGCAGWRVESCAGGLAGSCAEARVFAHIVQNNEFT